MSDQPRLSDARLREIREHSAKASVCPHYDGLGHGGTMCSCGYTKSMHYLRDVLAEVERLRTPEVREVVSRLRLLAADEDKKAQKAARTDELKVWHHELRRDAIQQAADLLDAGQE